MDGVLITDINVWFGIREPEWWPEDEEDDFEDRILKTEFKSKKPIRIFRHSF